MDGVNYQNEGLQSMTARPRGTFFTGVLNTNKPPPPLPSEKLNYVNDTCTSKLTHLFFKSLSNFKLRCQAGIYRVTISVRSADSSNRKCRSRQNRQLWCSNILTSWSPIKNFDHVGFINWEDVEVTNGRIQFASCKLTKLDGDDGQLMK